MLSEAKQNKTNCKLRIAEEKEMKERHELINRSILGKGIGENNI